MSRFILAGLLALVPMSLFAADGPRIRSLGIQTVGELTYFRVELDSPPGLTLSDTGKSGEAFVRRLTQQTRLIPQDGQSVVFFQPAVAGTDRLSFVGRLSSGRRPERWVMSYPLAPPRVKGVADLVRDARMATVDVRIDWAKAVEGKKSGDLADRWAAASGRRLAALEARAPEMGFFSVAREILGKHSGFEIAPLLEKAAPRKDWSAGLYELTTGAEAITDSLALARRNNTGGLDRGDRSVPIGALAGIDVPAHPWKKMMAGRKPRPEPLAGLVPEDNYYLTVSRLSAFVEAVDLLERWGGNVMRSFVLHDRDHALRARYEKQLCLPSAELAKAVPAKLINAVALTGHDLYLQDGADVTVLFDTTDPKAFLQLLAPYLSRARKEFGKRLRQSTSSYRKVAVDHFTTARREVSLHRAVVGKVVVCSNSEAALKRVIDLSACKGKALADALDFQYMRTVFVRDAKNEDGFAFVSDPFVRHLVGPAGRIGAKRRLEARAALTLASHAALFRGWQTGRLPKNHAELLDGALLRGSSLDVPDGKPVVWDGAAGQAFSEVYNTLDFTTPLVELPIRRVTSQEEADYDAFRTDYLKLWRRFFDPIGIRFRLDENRVRVETYILPLVNTSRYNDLRALARGLTTDDPARFAPGMLGRFLLGGKDDWLSLHLDGDEKPIRRLVSWAIRHDLNPAIGRADYERAVWKFPLVMTVRTPNPEEVSRSLVRLWKQYLRPREKELIERKYRGVSIREARIDANNYRRIWNLLKGFAELFDDDVPIVLAALLMLPEKEAPKAFYAASVGKEYYLSWSRKAVERQIDAALARKGKPADDEVDAGLRLSSKSGAANALKTWLEWRAHGKSLSSVAVWEALRQAGLGPTKTAEVRWLLGYVPISPDGSTFEVDKRLDEVRNSRHGSLSRPVCHDAPAAGSPVVALLEQLDRISVQVRFREDGVNTVLTLERKGK